MSSASKSYHASLYVILTHLKRCNPAVTLLLQHTTDHNTHISWRQLLIISCCAISFIPTLVQDYIQHKMDHMIRHKAAPDMQISNFKFVMANFKFEMQVMEQWCHQFANIQNPCLPLTNQVTTTAVVSRIINSSLAQYSSANTRIFIFP